MVDELHGSYVNRILLLCKIAEMKGVHLTLSELSLLLPSLSEDELRRRWPVTGALSSKFRIEGNYVIPLDSPQSHGDDANKLERARSNILLASQFLALCGKSRVRCVSVSGSTSYLTAGPLDDIDLFCITYANQMWLFLTRALILARIFRYLRRGRPQLTLALTMDTDYALRIFASPRDPLFARDALTTVQLFGGEFYMMLLKQGHWMKDIFPQLYEKKVSNNGPTDSAIGGQVTSVADRAFNLLLYVVVGTYIKAKSWLFSRYLAKLGRKSAIFRVRAGPDHLIYESAHYLTLRHLYAKIQPFGRSKSGADFE